jgi:hypothetical protein
MATWQFDLFIVRRVDPSPVVLEGGWDVPGLPQQVMSEARTLLEQSLEEPFQVTPDWLSFGEESGNRVDLLFGENGGGELAVRIDARKYSESFMALLVKLASATGCWFFSPEFGTHLEADLLALFAALDQSRAAAFCASPRDFMIALKCDY